MQFHVELDAHKLADWSASTDPSFLELQQHHVTVQSGAEMRAQAAQALTAQQDLAARIYGHWLGLSRVS